MPTFSLATPGDYDLKRDVCSYGYFLLAPNHWNPKTQTFTRPLLLSDSVQKSWPVVCAVSQPQGIGTHLRVATSLKLNAALRADAARQLTRMLALDVTEAQIAEFHRLDPRWLKSGRGRLMRSPDIFEDIIKTVTSCNVTWPSTIVMNRRLCEVLGSGCPPASLQLAPKSNAPARQQRAYPRTFPIAAKIGRAKPATLRARCRVGYRDARIVALGKLFATPVSRARMPWLFNPNTSDDELFRELQELPGIGPYAAANIMQLLGRFSKLPLDSESVRHGKTLLGFTGSPAQIMKKVQTHFAPFGQHAFRSYWFEMWTFYESKHGPAWTWERDTTGTMFTAALLK